MGRKIGLALVVAGAVAVATGAGAGVARAREVAVAGQLQEGYAVDGSGVHRVRGGVVLLLGRVALDGMLDLEAWHRWKKDRGTAGSGVGVDAGVRVALGQSRLRGPFVSAGATALYMVGDPEKKLSASGVDRSDVGPGAFAPRLGVGWGFHTTTRITIAVRLDAAVWFFQGLDFPPEADDPHPNPLSIHLGLEFTRW